jgi:hypothetical protein
MWLVSQLSVNFCLSLCGVDCCGVYGMRLSYIHLILVNFMLSNIGVTWVGGGGDATPILLPENSLSLFVGVLLNCSPCLSVFSNAAEWFCFVYVFLK